jgi:hypothetical protein
MLEPFSIDNYNQQGDNVLVNDFLDKIIENSKVLAVVFICSLPLIIFGWFLVRLSYR